MKRHIYHITSFSIVGAFTLRVAFDDQTSRTIDFRPVLGGEVFSPLKDLSFFNQVRLDPEIDTIVWPNGADFDPATLHDWPEYEIELSRRAKAWDEAAAKHSERIPRAFAVAEDTGEYGISHKNPKDAIPPNQQTSH